MITGNSFGNKEIIKFDKSDRIISLRINDAYCVIAENEIYLAIKNSKYTYVTPTPLDLIKFELTNTIDPSMSAILRLGAFLNIINEVKGIDPSFTFIIQDKEDLVYDVIRYFTSMIVDTDPMALHLLRPVDITKLLDLVIEIPDIDTDISGEIIDIANKDCKSIGFGIFVTDTLYIKLGDNSYKYEYRDLTYGNSSFISFIVPIIIFKYNLNISDIQGIDSHIKL